MGLIWPAILILLGIIPMIIGAYIWILRRRKRYTLRYSSLSLVAAALPQQSRLRRHLPFALFTLALTSLIVAFGRPYAEVTLPVGQTTVILAMDVSRSMCAIDIKPNRLRAAKDAALSFVERQKPGVQIGIVAFAGYAELVQIPTADKEILAKAIERLTTGHRTAIGSAILESVDAISEINKNVVPSAWYGAPPKEGEPAGDTAEQPDLIILLSDGASNAGPMPLDAAGQAKDRGLRVYTIGFGTPDGSMMDCGEQNGFGSGGSFGGNGQFGGGQSFGGGWFRRGIDEPTLKEVAFMTGGEYFSAESAGELNRVFENMPISIITRTEKSEISFAFAAFGALLAALAIFLSLIWQPLPY